MNCCLATLRIGSAYDRFIINPQSRYARQLLFKGAYNSNFDAALASFGKGGGTAISRDGGLTYNKRRRPLIFHFSLFIIHLIYANYLNKDDKKWHL